MLFRSCETQSGGGTSTNLAMEHSMRSVKVALAILVLLPSLAAQEPDLSRHPRFGPPPDRLSAPPPMATAPSDKRRSIKWVGVVWPLAAGMAADERADVKPRWFESILQPISNGPRISWAI
jgi:hypothetical protein